MAHSVGNIGVTEAQLFNMGIHLLSAALAGTNFWVQRFSALVPASTPALAAAGCATVTPRGTTDTLLACVFFGPGVRDTQPRTTPNLRPLAPIFDAVLS